jgi:hypothetical protein
MQKRLIHKIIGWCYKRSVFDDLHLLKVLRRLESCPGVLTMNDGEPFCGCTDIDTARSARTHHYFNIYGSLEVLHDVQHYNTSSQLQSSELGWM